MSKEHPILPLIYDWSLGANIKTDMDNNLRMLGTLSQLGVLSRTSDEPSSPSNGDRYIHNGGDWSKGSEGDLMVYLDEKWRSYSPSLGWIAFVEDEDVNVIRRTDEWKALNQYGSNDDGTYMQLMGGFLIQVKASLDLEYEDSNVCRATWNFPKEFNGDPISVVPNVRDLSGSAPGPEDIGLARATDITSSSATIEVYRVTGTTDFGSGDVITVSLTAVGAGDW